MADRELPAFDDLHYIHSSEACLHFLRHGNGDEAPILGPLHCMTEGCNERMLTNIKTPTQMRCTRCKKSKTIFKNSCFDNAKLPLHIVMQLAYDWLNQCTVKQMRNRFGLAPGTATEWVRYFQQLIAADLDDPEEQQQIGGPGIIVEIDEAKFGKRKYNRGHRVVGVWVVGGVEITPERRMFAVAVENRNAQTLRDLIARNVAAGSTVHTDRWRGYRTADLQQLGLQHGTVNHSEHFVDPDTNVHTNHIEGTWTGIRYL